MQAVKVHMIRFECNLCGKKYPDNDKAKKCFEVHSKVIEKLIAGYKPGARMMARFLGESDGSEMAVTIIKTEGELVNFKALVEAEDGSRWWEYHIVSYQTGDSVSESIQNQPTNFFTWHPLVP